jgi:acetyltransferase-like isoleucine patch superfamily enzyme
MTEHGRAKGGSAVRRYQDLVVGERGLWPLVRYELLTGLLGSLPGALGLFLRSSFYPALLGSAGRKLVVGRSVTLRGPGRIHLEKGVTLGDYVELSARGDSSSIRISEHTLVGRGTIIHARDGTIEIGPQGSIGTNCRLGTSSGLRIGRFSLFASGCSIGGGDHPFEDSAVPMASRPAVSKGGVTIGDDVWLGIGVTVLDGVTIGQGAVLGACSLVTRDIPEMAIAYGIPARVVRFRDGWKVEGGS